MDSKTWGTRPSVLLGLESGSYEAYCLDQAIGYLGTQLEYELERAGEKPNKNEKKIEAARKKVLEKYMSQGKKKKQTKGFADPALLFGK